MAKNDLKQEILETLMIGSQEQIESINELVEEELDERICDLLDIIKEKAVTYTGKNKEGKKVTLTPKVIPLSVLQEVVKDQGIIWL